MPQLCPIMLALEMAHVMHCDSSDSSFSWFFPLLPTNAVEPDLISFFQWAN